jgi:hypothetical protein
MYGDTFFYKSHTAQITLIEKNRLPKENQHGKTEDDAGSV